MNRLRNIVLIMLCTQLFFIACQTGNSIVTDDGINRKEIHYKGEIIFNDDETAIESISPDGYLQFRSNGRKLIVESNYHGGLAYKMYKGGKRLNEDEPAGKKFLAEAIDQMINMGLNTQKRIERLYSREGNPALLKAAVNIESNYIKQQYLDYVLTKGDPSADDLTDVANITAFTMNGAFEKSQVLKKFPTGFFDNAEVADTWFAAVKTVDSDFEKAGILKGISVANFESPGFSGKWLTAVQSISSSFEKSNTLKIILQQPLNDEQYRQSIAAANTIEGDFEHAQFLKDIINKEVPDNDESFIALIHSIHKVESDFERSDILKKLIDKDLHNDKQWEALLNESATLHGDFEKANVFLSAAGKMPKTEEVKAAYINGAKTISSEFEQERAMKGIE